MPTPSVYYRMEREAEQMRAEIARLRGAIDSIRAATIAGRVCNDVAWFSDHETLHDFCKHTLAASPDQLALFPEPDEPALTFEGSLI